MNHFTVARYLFGEAKAIREVAGNRNALWLGTALVLLTGVARNYDQRFFTESPFWLFGPLLFSFFSGSFLYWIVVRVWANHCSDQNKVDKGRWREFMAIFWMTAPIAWLYAIPVERFAGSYEAAQANLTLLGIVSAWRVLLLSRAISVLMGSPFYRAFLWVLVGASIEVIVVVFIGIGERTLAGMSGMRNSAEETLLLNVLGFIWAGSFAVLTLAALMAALIPLRCEILPIPKSEPGKTSWKWVGLVALFWIAIAIPAQIEQKRFAVHAALVNNGNYREAIDFLAKHAPSDFPPGRLLEPTPYEYRIWEHLPGMIAELKPETPKWIRDVYLSRFEVSLKHYFHRYKNIKDVEKMLVTIASLPEGPSWAQANEQGLVRQRLLDGFSRESQNDPAATTNALAALRKLGLSEKSLNKME